MIAALFVQANGCYSGLENVDPWPESRDARLYAGPWPVVAHPPCARWCRLAGLVEARWGHKRGEDGGCFASALASVRKWGGVLEHPAYSDAWAKFGLPVPSSSGGWHRGICGGWSCHVEQGRYGHAAKKATWLYAFGVDALPTLKWGSVADQETHARVSWCGNATRGAVRPRLKQKAAAATPPHSEMRSWKSQATHGRAHEPSPAECHSGPVPRPSAFHRRVIEEAVVIPELTITAHALERLQERAGITDPDWLPLEIGRSWRWRQAITDRGEPRVLVPLRGGAWALIRDSTVVTVLTNEMRRNGFAWGRYRALGSAAADVTDAAQDAEPEAERHALAAVKAARMRTVTERLFRAEFALTWSSP